MPSLSRVAMIAASALLCALASCAPVGPRIRGPAGAQAGGIENTAANVIEWNEPAPTLDQPFGGGIVHRSVIHGQAPAIVGADSAGARWQGSNQPRTVTFASETPDGVRRVATIIDPSDTELSGFEMLPDGTVRLAAFGALASRPIESSIPAILASLEATGRITAEQAATTRAAIAAGADAAVEIAALVAKIAAPVPVP